jgi:hypothetical protein
MVGLGDAGFDFDRTAISRDATPGATLAHSLLHGIAGRYHGHEQREVIRATLIESFCFHWGYLSL